MDDFIKTRVACFVSIDNTRCHAGTVRLFSDRGPSVYHYHREASSPDWAIKRIWYFYLFALIHVSEGKSTSLPGWHMTFAGISFKKQYQGFSISWKWADRYQSIRQTFWERMKERFNGHRRYRY